MSEILSRLAGCKQVTEWLNPCDSRLVAATGESSPNRGANIREEWWIEKHEFSLLALAVKRILVPRSIGSRVLALTTGDVDYNRVVLRFEEPDDWSACFPTEDGTQIFTNQEAEVTWAAVGLCDAVLGLAVFAQKNDGEVDARIQPVPDEVFAKIIGDGK